MIRRIRIRTLLLGGFLTLLFLGLFIRIYWVQVAHASFWAEQARQTWITSKPLPQERGTITDRDGKVLAADTQSYTLAVGPQKIHQLEEDHPEWKLLDQIVSKIHLVLDKPEVDVRDDVNAKKDDGTYLVQREVRTEGWKMDKDVAERLMKFRDQLKEQTGQNDVGLYFIEDQKRFYPKNSLAAQVLGYEDKDGNARMGLERTLNDVLKGEPGHITYEKDGIRTQLPDGQLEVKQAVDGKNVTLTIDQDIQFYMDQAMREAYAKYNPVSMTAVAADPKTGDILGMVSLPDFDPNKYWLTKDQSAFKNNAIQSVYEPGSTFKIVTLAASVQEGIFDPNKMYKSGSIHVTGGTIHDYNWTGWGEISFLDGLKHSSNVAFVNLGMELGREKLKSYIDNFGFGVKTGLELAGEVPGDISFYYPIEVATAAFGQGKVLVTPIQQVAAIGAVANGGKLMVPHLIKSIEDPKTGEKTVTEPKVVRQVISEETSRQVGDYLETVVSDQQIGTGRNAYIPGYRIAGKTGTAQVVVDGKYAEDKYVVSFIGYAPVEDPKIVLYILIDQPDDRLAGGGSAAAPVFKQIMEQSLRHLGVKPKLTEEEAKKLNDEDEPAAPVTATVPNVKGMTVTQAKNALADRAFPAEVLGKGTKVLQQLPKADSVYPTSQSVYLVTESAVGSVPSLKGMSLRDALEMCGLLEATCVPNGEGYVVTQQSAKANGKLVVTLNLAPPGEEASVKEADAAEGEDGASDGTDGGEASGSGSGDKGSGDANGAGAGGGTGDGSGSGTGDGSSESGG